MVVTIDKISTTTIEPKTPGEYAGSAVVVTLSVANDSKRAQSVDSAVVSLVTDDGDIGVATTAGPNKPLQGELAAGAKTTGTYVFMLDPTQGALGEDQRQLRGGGAGGDVRRPAFLTLAHAHHRNISVFRSCTNSLSKKKTGGWGVTMGNTSTTRRALSALASVVTAALLVAGMTTLGAQAASADVPSTPPPLLQRDDNVVTSDPDPDGADRQRLCLGAGDDRVGPCTRWASSTTPVHHPGRTRHQPDGAFQRSRL